ncbi:MAG: VOC family protein, partial [Gammaproteobacteria bacterium]
MTITKNTNDPRQDNCPWMMPILYVADVQKSLDFYEKAFGFKTDVTMKEDDGSISYANMLYKGEKLFMIIREGCQLAPDGISPKSSKAAAPLSIYVYCDDIDVLAKQASSNKAVVLCEPEDAFWGDRTAVLQDPDEFVWSFATKIPN